MPHASRVRPKRKETNFGVSGPLSPAARGLSAIALLELPQSGGFQLVLLLDDEWPEEESQQVAV